MNSELLPCPFCGGKGYVICGSSFTFGFPSYSVECEKCGTVGIVKGSEQEAIEAWNTRAERTCKWVWMESYNTTTAINECEYAGWALDCGCFDEPIEELERFDNPEEKPNIGWNHCPNCGARVVQ